MQPSEVMPNNLTLALFFSSQRVGSLGHLIFSAKRVLMSDSSVYPLQNSRLGVRATPLVR